MFNLDKKETTDQIRKLPISFVVLGFMAVIGFCVDVSVLMSQEQTSTPVVPELSEYKRSAVSITRTHNSLGKAMRIDQSCYDYKSDVWFVHATKSKDEGWTEGWYYELNDNMRGIHMSNDSYALTNTADIFNDNIYPDITGLDCKLHTPRS